MSDKPALKTGSCLWAFAYGGPWPLPHAGSFPAQRHPRIAPALNVPTNTAHCTHHIFDRIGADERAALRRWKDNPINGEHLVEPSEEAGAPPALPARAGARDYAAAGLIGILKVRGLPQRATSRGIWAAD